MKRPVRLLKVALLLSTTLCAVAILQVFRSEVIFDAFAVEAGGRSWRMSSGGGMFQCGVFRGPSRDTGWQSTNYAGMHATNHLRIALSSGPGQVRVTLRFWLIALISAPPGVVWMARRSAATRREQHRERCRAQRICPACAYDLRATPDRCPECGLAIVLTQPTPHEDQGRLA